MFELCGIVFDEPEQYSTTVGTIKALHWWEVLFRAYRELTELGIPEQFIVEQLVPELDDGRGEIISFLERPEEWEPND